jgi:hypothetical protein
MRCMYIAVLPRPMPAAVASRCCRCKFKHLACACGTAGWRAAACLK